MIVSAGGYNGTKLGAGLRLGLTTAAAYQQVITTYGLHAFDFDLEEPEIENSTAIANELGAAQILHAGKPGLVHLDHHAVHHEWRKLVRPAAARRSEEPGLHPE